MDLCSVPQIESLDELVEELHRIFESESVNVDYVHQVMAAYKSRPKDWKKYASFDRYRYTRNLVDAGNGKFNLMILAWAEGQGSSIHDHSNSHCFMKVLHGSLTEVRYEWPNDTLIENNGMNQIDEVQLKKNEIAYMNDSLGLHRVENRSHSDTAVSLHLYCPPYEKCQMFDQRTGHKSVGKVTFWSKYGERAPHIMDSSGSVTVHYENNWRHGRILRASIIEFKYRLIQNIIYFSRQILEFKSLTYSDLKYINMWSC